MSVYSEITRITGLRNRIRNKLINLGLMSASQRTGDNDLEDCTDTIEDIGGTQSITTTQQYNVADKQYAQVSDSNLVSQNIAEGVTILGITGTHSGSTPPTPTQSKDIILGTATAPSTIYPDSGYLLSSVTPAMGSPCTLIPENIKSGVTIHGVTGTYGTNYGWSIIYHPTIVSNREIQIPLVSSITDISQLVSLHVSVEDDSAFAYNTVLYAIIMWDSAGCSFVDSSTSTVKNGSMTGSFLNGTLTLLLPSGSNYSFGNSYSGIYTYTY